MFCMTSTKNTCSSRVSSSYKASRVYLNNQGTIKVEDPFNACLAKRIASNSSHSDHGFRYQSLELLLNLTPSTPLKNDVWSLGLIFLELLLGESLFARLTSPKHLVETLFALFGREMLGFEGALKKRRLWPSNGVISRFAKGNLRAYLYKKAPKYLFLTRLDRSLINFLSGCLTLDSTKRFSIKEALTHEIFTSHPQPCDKSK